MAKTEKSNPDNTIQEEKELRDLINNGPADTVPFKQQSEVLPPKTQRKFRTVITGAEFWEPTEGEVFEGTYIENVIRKKDGPKAATEPNQKAGALMGYLFKADNGREEIVGNSQQVMEVMSNCKFGDYVRFTFLGKGETAAKQPFNRFRIEVAE